MYYNPSKRSYELIGTVQGSGYDCRTNTVATFENSEDGLWNKVSHWVDWIKGEMQKLGEESCS